MPEVCLLESSQQPCHRHWDTGFLNKFDVRIKFGITIKPDNKPACDLHPPALYLPNRTQEVTPGFLLFAGVLSFGGAEECFIIRTFDAEEYHVESCFTHCVKHLRDLNEVYAGFSEE